MGRQGVVDVMDRVVVLLYQTHSFPLACLIFSAMWYGLSSLKTLPYILGIFFASWAGFCKPIFNPFVITWAWVLTLDLLEFFVWVFLSFICNHISFQL